MKLEKLYGDSDILKSRKNRTSAKSFTNRPTIEELLSSRTVKVIVAIDELLEIFRS